MTSTQAILNYATLHDGSFKLKDLKRDVIGNHADLNERALDLQIARLLSSGVIIRTGRGEYRLTQNYLNDFVYRPSDQEKEIYERLKRQFPFLELCIWSPKVLASYMLHVPNIGYSFVDVEKVGMESVFHALQAMDLKRHILLAPSQKECERYLIGTDAIVVRQLIGQSPLTVVEGCNVPRIEKILVDTISDNELMFASGSELFNIFENALERHNINMKKMLRYASRRNREEKVKNIIQTVYYDKSTEQIHRMDKTSSPGNGHS